MSRLILLFICVLSLSKFIEPLRFGSQVLQKRPENQALVVIHHSYPESYLKYSMGNLIHRKFIIGHGNLIDSDPKKILVRIGTLRMMEDGVVRWLDWAKYIKISSNLPSWYEVTLMRLEMPYDFNDFAFLMLPGLRPVSPKTAYVVSGFGGDQNKNKNRLNHLLNTMRMVKASDRCFTDYYDSVKEFKSHMMCYYSFLCGGTECKHKQGVDIFDSGAGVFIQNTNILTGLTLGIWNMSSFEREPNPISLHIDPVYHQIIEEIRLNNYDEYALYPEWTAGWDPFKNNTVFYDYDEVDA